MMSNPQVKFISNRDGGDRLTNNPSEQVPSSYRVISDDKHVGLAVKRNGKWGFYLKHREPRDEFDDDIYDFSRAPFAFGKTLAAVGKPSGGKLNRVCNANKTALHDYVVLHAA